jgi:DNA-binding PadR family transcriptional regulator
MSKASEFDPQRLARSVTELLVLGMLRRGAMHGYRIAREAAESSGGAFTVSHGTLYPVLRRLERAGLVRSTIEAGEGARRRVYVLTPAGASHLGAEGRWVREVMSRLAHLVNGDGGA